jgi:hypothetical protein
MNENAYRLLALVAWRGTKWYVRKRGLSTLTVATVGVGGLVAIGGAALLARRSAESAKRKQLGPGPTPNATSTTA